MFLVFVMVTVAWAVIGLILWIPLLVRITTLFTIMVIHATVTGQKPDALRIHIESAIHFYPVGFRFAYDAVYNPGPYTPIKTQFKRVYQECFWTVVFWVLTLTLFHPTIIAPLWGTSVTAGVTFWKFFKNVKTWWLYVFIGAIIFLLGRRSRG